MTNRIRELREGFGWTQEELGERIGANKSQVSKLEAGETRLNPDWRRKIARAFGLRPGAVDEESAPLVARLYGAAGAGEQVLPFSGTDFTGEPIPCPPDFVSPVALVVRGDSMEPAYLDGDILLYERATGVPPEALRRDCVVQVHDGPTYVKTLLPGSKRGLYSLASHNRRDVILDQRLDWAAPIRWIKRG